MLTIRDATAADESTIKSMIREANLDPTSLKWQNFLIAEMEGKTVGIGQVKIYPGCRELGSLVVLKPYRRHGIASQLIEALETRHPRPIYLLCASHLGKFYGQFDYQTIGWLQAPAMLKLKTIFALPLRLFRIRILIMVKK